MWGTKQRRRMRLSAPSSSRPGCVAALELVGAVGLRAIVVGEVAGALHSWPLMLSDEGTLDLVVHPEDRRVSRADWLTRSCWPLDFAPLHGRPAFVSANRVCRHQLGEPKLMEQRGA
jgi:hypothetical protein